MFLALGSIWVTWLISAGALVGIGLLVGKALEAKPNFIDAFWLGTATVVLGLQPWNLFFPVDARAGLLVLGLGCVGWLPRFRRELVFSSRPRLFAALLIAGAVWLSDRALGPLANGDSFTYHLQAVRWAAEYPVVPGVALLHPFLGVSHGFFPFAALFDAIPHGLGARHLANGLLTWGFLGLVARGAVELTSRWRAPHVVELVLLPWAVFVCVGSNVASVSSDVCEVALGAALASSWIASLDRTEPGNVERLVVLGAALCIVKLSGVGAVVGLALGIVATHRSTWRRVAVTALIVGLSAGVPWCVGSVLRSGYLPYPGGIAVDVDWRVPTSVAVALEAYTLSFGRGTLAHWETPRRDWDWVVPRVERLLTDNQEVLLPLGLAALALGWGLLRAERGKRLQLLVALVPAGAALTFWFSTSPDTRYAGVWLQATAGLAAGAAVLAMSRVDAGRLTVVLVMASLLRAAELVTSFGVGWFSGDGPAPTPTAEVVSFTSEAGATVWRAVQECGATPLPCAVAPDPALERRDDVKLGAGFRLQPPVDLDTYRPAVRERFNFSGTGAK